MNTPTAIAQYTEALLQLSIVMMGGIYLIFSNTILGALKQHDSGADVMVLINKVILNPLFMACFWISGLYSAYLALFGQGVLIACGALFFVGTTMVTVVNNVPLNNRLLDAAPGPERAEVWQMYLQKWVRWNHVRSVSAALSCFLMLTH